MEPGGCGDGVLPTAIPTGNVHPVGPLPVGERAGRSRIQVLIAPESASPCYVDNVMVKQELQAHRPIRQKASNEDRVRMSQ